MAKESEIQQEQYWGFTATVIFGGITFLAFVVSQMLAMGAYIGYRYGEVADEQLNVLMFELQNNGTVLSLCTITSLVVCSLLMTIFIKLKKSASIKSYLALNRFSFKDSKIWFGYLLLALIAIDLTTVIVDKDVVPPFMEAVYNTADPVWLLWLAIVIAAPLFEELFFRGFLLSGLSTSFVGPSFAVIVTSAFWAVIHVQYELYYIATIFLLGLLFGFARLKSGSTWLTIIMHAVVNFIAMIQVLFTLS